MKDIEAWVKLLYTYGPFALLVFFVFVTEGKARKANKELHNKVSISIYVANWVIIFGLVTCAIYAWYRINISEEYVIQGTFENLEGSETLTSRSVDLYLKRVYGTGGRFDYHWRLITPARIPEGSKIRFYFDRSTYNSEKTSIHEVIVHSSFYEQKIRIVFYRNKDKVVVKHDGSEEELPDIEENVAAVPDRGTSPFISPAFAQGTFSTKEMTKRLESNDPIIRHDARTDLAEQGRSALPWIQAVLTDKGSSFRLRYGVIEALNKMTDLRPEDLHPALVMAVIETSVQEDPSLQREARYALAKYSNWNVAAEIDRVLSEARKQLSPGTKTSPRVARLARTSLDVLYNLGVSEKDKYGSRKPEDRGRISKAIEAFEKAWKLREFTYPDDRVVFAKTLYGWGHALHDRSWIERRLDETRDPAMVKAAQDKFAEFLKEIQQSKDPKAYPYPQHIKQAEAYMRNPVPQSLQ